MNDDRAFLTFFIMPVGSILIALLFLFIDKRERRRERERSRLERQ
jgi:hypothetical protein